MQLHSKRPEASADLIPGKLQDKRKPHHGQPLLSLSQTMTSPWPPCKHRGAGCCPVTRAPCSSLLSATTHTVTSRRASCPSREQKQTTPRSLSPGEDRQEQATAASGCHIHLSFAPWLRCCPNSKTRHRVHKGSRMTECSSDPSSSGKWGVHTGASTSDGTSL